MFDDVDDITFGIEEEGPTPSPIEEGVVVVQPPELPLDLSATQAELEQLFTSRALDFGIYQFLTAVALIT